MTVYYVRNAGSNTAPYDTWAKAATSIAVITAIPVAAADTIWVADDHAGSTASTVTWTCPTTPGLKILCANTHVTEPPTAEGTGASETVTGLSNLAVTGYAYIKGVAITVGTSTNSINITFGHTGTLAIGIILDTCPIYIASTNAACYLALGSSYSGGIGTGVSVQLINCTLRLSATGQLIRLLAGKIEISGLSFHASSTAPTTLFQLATNSAATGETLVDNSDISGKTFTNLSTVSSIGNLANLDVINGKLPASITVVTGSFANYGSQRVRVFNCDSGDTHIRMATHQYAGVNTSDTAIVRTGGAVQDDAQAHSWRMTGNANTSLLYPLRSPRVVIWNDTVGSSVTLTMSFIRDSVTNLKDSEVWVEVSYHGTSGFPLASGISDRVATVSTTAADQAADSGSTWANSMTNPNKQAMSVTFTPQEVGYFTARVCLGANTAINVDPTPILT